MGDKSAIEWTDATWNPVIGCTRISDGCRNCYAFSLHDRRHLAHKRGTWPAAPAQYHVPFSQVQTMPDRLDQPLRWRRPRRIFVNSLSDLFHEAVPDEFIMRIFAVMILARHHRFQLLTKRPKRLQIMLTDSTFWAGVVGVAAEAGDSPCADARVEDVIDDSNWAIPNVWLGVSAENQAAADERIPLLLQTPAAVRFVSCEPLLGPVDFVQSVNKLDWLDSASLRPGGLDWVIAGGESGPHARPMHRDWARSLRDQCLAAGVPYFFKQWGEWAPAEQSKATHLLQVDGGLITRASCTTDEPYGPGSGMAQDLVDRDHPGWVRVARLGKKAAGRVLDGQVWDQLPEVRP